MKYLLAVSSFFIWGSGQLFNKQYYKAAFFFAFQFILVSVELFTGTFAVLTNQVEYQFRNAGFFTKGIWGLITLGEIPRTNSSVKVYDHSVLLLITGLIAVFFLLIFLFILFVNVKDAYKVRKQIEKGYYETDKEYFKNVWENSFEYIMIAPGMFLTVFITVIPITFALLTSFTNYNTNNIPPKNIVEWTGFETFISIMSFASWSNTFFKILWWNITWALVGAGSCYLFGMLQAIIINSDYVKFKKLWRSIFILPWAIPGFLSLMIFKVMLVRDGPINNILLDVGIINEAIPFLSDKNWARSVVLLVNLWLGFPYSMALISGILTTISKEFYEAADIDGANGIQKFRYITFPLVFTATLPTLILSITFTFNNFGAIYLLTGGGPGDPSYQMAGTTDILITWIFKLTVDQRMYNYASAISIFIFIFLAFISIINLSRTKTFKES